MITKYRMFLPSLYVTAFCALAGTTCRWFRINIEQLLATNNEAMIDLLAVKFVANYLLYRPVYTDD